MAPVPAGSTADEDRERARREATDAIYTAVGFGVLGFHRLQVARREIAREARQGLERLAPVAREVARQSTVVLDPVLDRVTERLAEPGRSFVRVARGAARGWID